MSKLRKQPETKHAYTNTLEDSSMYHVLICIHNTTYLTVTNQYYAYSRIHTSSIAQYHHHHHNTRHNVYTHPPHLHDLRTLPLLLKTHALLFLIHLHPISHMHPPRAPLHLPPPARKLQILRPNLPPRRPRPQTEAGGGAEVLYARCGY
jgi:hypothetical protein